MCNTCGCGQPGEEVTIRKPGGKKQDKEQTDSDLNYSRGNPDFHHGHHHHHHEHHNHAHDNHSFNHGREIIIEQDILQKNNLLAERNRGYFEAKGVTTLNLVSSPGSGKTSLLVKTIHELKNKHKFYVIEGDQQTMNDAERIHSTGTQVVQINTGQGCHLDAIMIHNALKELDIEEKGFLMIENVGNLVCPALFDLGEAKRVVIMSVTEGDDKPVKYPTMFQSADLCIINKIDLLPYVDFNMDKAREYAEKVNHHLEFVELSVQSGKGLEEWYRWLQNL